MHLLALVGISHRTAPVELRERVDFQARGVEHALRALAARRSRARELAVALDLQPRRALRGLRRRRDGARRTGRRSSATFHGVDAAALEPHVYDVGGPRGGAAPVPRRRRPRLARRRRAADSRPGQGSARRRQRRADRRPVLLNRLFHSSFAVGKRVRIGNRARRGRRLGRATPRSRSRRRSSATSTAAAVVVIGAGRDGQAHGAAHEVAGRPAASRSSAGRWRTRRGRPRPSAARRAAPWDEMDAALGASDIVITATGAAAPILTKARIEAVMRPRRSRPLFIIDIAVPRDVEAGGRRNRAGLPLQHRRSAGDGPREPGAARRARCARAEAIVDEELDKFGAWLRSRGVDSDGRRAAAVASRRSAAPSSIGSTSSCRRCRRSATSARARRRDHASDRREAAADADRAAQVARRPETRRASTRRRSRAVRPRRDGRERSSDGDGRRSRRASGRPRRAVPARQNARAALTWRTRPELRLGTRGSQLALWQAQRRCGAHRGRGGPPCRIVVIKTSGDRAAGRGRCRKSAASGCSSRKSKTRCSRNDDRPRGAQQQGHAGAAAGRPGDRRRAAARGSARRRGAAAQTARAEGRIADALTT